MCNSQPRMPTCSLWITNQWACISLTPFSTWGFSCDGRMNGKQGHLRGCQAVQLWVCWSQPGVFPYRYTETGGSYSTGCNKKVCVSLCVCVSVLWLASGRPIPYIKKWGKIILLFLFYFHYCSTTCCLSFTAESNGFFLQNDLVICLAAATMVWSHYRTTGLIEQTQ